VILLCLRSFLKIDGAKVLAAIESSKCSVVVYDWLEDCLVGKRPKLRRVDDYLLQTVTKRINTAKKRKASLKDKYIQDGLGARDLVDSSKPPLPHMAYTLPRTQSHADSCISELFHTYTDAIGFDHKIILTRFELRAHAPMLSEKYTLFVSDPNPQLTHSTAL
jgi:hypothetical protein